MKKNKSWFSILIWMWLMVLITLTAYVILSFIIPFSKNIKWIENSSVSYYQAYSWIEKALMFLKNRPNLVTETWSVMSDLPKAFSYNTFSSWSKVPEKWYWNSEYSTWYNIISKTEPLQIELWKKVHWINNLFGNNIKFIFKVPDFWEWITYSFSWWNNPIINWILSSDNNTLYSTWGSVFWTDIHNSDEDELDWIINNKSWITLLGLSKTFSEFYQENCDTDESECVLKMSVLDDLFLINWTQIPYLEYKIDFWNSNIPDRYTRVESYGKSYGFQKKLDVRVPQQTINQAFDFTVFQ